MVNSLFWIVKIKTFSFGFLAINFYYFVPINESGIKIDVVAVKKAKDDPTSEQSGLHGYRAF
jgi:hypothetical protein